MTNGIQCVLISKLQLTTCHNSFSTQERTYYDFLQQTSKIHPEKFCYFIASSICGKLSHLETDSGGILVWFPDRLVLPAYDHCGLYEKKFLCYRTAFSRFHRARRRNQLLFPVILRFHAAGCADFLPFPRYCNGLFHSVIRHTGNSFGRRTYLLLASQKGIF